MNNTIIDYLKGWCYEDGTNITITCDFIMQVEELIDDLKDVKEMIYYLKTHNRNYNKEQYNKIIEIDEILEELGVK
jgi:hypothetical protein